MELQNEMGVNVICKTIQSNSCAHEHIPAPKHTPRMKQVESHPKEHRPFSSIAHGVLAGHNEFIHIHKRHISTYPTIHNTHANTHFQICSVEHVKFNVWK